MEPTRFFAVLSTVAGLALLPACGGGGSSAGRSGPDTFLLGDVLMSAQGQLFRASSSCRGTSCTITFQGQSETVNLSGLDPNSATPGVTNRQTHNGVNVSRLALRDGEFSFDTYGAWGDYNVASPARGSAFIQGIRFEYVAPMSFGNRSGTNPVSGSASWRGVMVGAKIRSSGVGAEVIGDAALTADLGAASLGLEFTNIAERFSGARSSDIRWQGVPMRSGAFSASGLQGRFYGPNHEEAGGVFERNGITGAFSLARN